MAEGFWAFWVVRGGIFTEDQLQVETPGGGGYGQEDSLYATQPAEIFDANQRMAIFPLEA